MLGTLHDKWDKSESVDIKAGDTYIIVRGKRLEVMLEEKNNILTKLKCFYIVKHLRKHRI